MNLKLKCLLIIIVIFTLSVFSYEGFAGDAVDFGNNTCEDENIVYKLSSLNNAHVAVWSYNSNNYLDVCFENDEGHECKDFNNDGINDNVVFRIYNNSGKPYNAHVEQKGMNSSGYVDLCFGEVVCSYNQSCSQGEECFGSISSVKNSHIGDCSVYEAKICCKTGCSIERVFWSKDGNNEITSAKDKDVVLLVVDGSNGCKNERREVNLTIKESRGGSFYNVNVKFNSDGDIEYPWEARRESSLIGNTAYYFEAKLGSQILTSRNLEVLPRTVETGFCGDGILSYNEVCDIGRSSTIMDDIFVNGVDDCSDHSSNWIGNLTCVSCNMIDTSSCKVKCGNNTDCGDIGPCDEGFCIGDNECDNGILEPGESCDGDDFFAEINTCREVSGDLVGDLECDDCQYDINECTILNFEGESCNSCSSCDNIFGGNECTQSVCVNACPGVGSCYYDLGIGEDCKPCNLIDSCEDYKNDLDCEIDRCLVMGENPCEWKDDECVENDKCRWDCDNTYSECVNGYSQKVSSCVLISGGCDAVNDNPARNYPNEISCIGVEEEYPVFTLFNLIISIVLIIGYYFIKKKKG